MGTILMIAVGVAIAPLVGAILFGAFLAACGLVAFAGWLIVFVLTTLYAIPMWIVNAIAQFLDFIFRTKRAV